MGVYMAINKSTGPRTEKGKKVVSQNALKSGVYARNIVLTNESLVDFEAHHQRFINDFRPQDIVASQLVRDMAVVVWKRMRLERIENKALTDLLDAPIRDEETRDSLYLWRPEIAELVSVVNEFNDECLRETNFALEYALKLEIPEFTDEEILHYMTYIPLINILFNKRFAEYELTPSFKNLGAKSRELDMDRRENAFPRELLSMVIKELIKTQWLCTHRDVILKEYEAIRNRRLMAFMENAGTSRAFDDLRRSFSKLLAEYRRHESWRVERQMLDMGLIESAPA